MSLTKPKTKEVRHNSANKVLKGSNLLSTSNPPDCPTQNVAAYMAGYLLRKIPMSDCQLCQSELVNANQSAEDRYTFLNNKSYKGTGCLIYPSALFCQFVERLEAVFNGVFPFLMHNPGVLNNLVNHADESKSLRTCDEERCKFRIVALTTLYMKIRIYHALKMSNISNTLNTGKRNKKFLKLMHL